MRVISFVPSWTETLIESGVNVVGRTRFCIHPRDQVKDIPIVGGTKNILFDKLIELKPDLIIFDKEENNKEMADLCEVAGLSFLATHVVDLVSCGQELIRLGQTLSNDKLIQFGNDYLEIKKNGISESHRFDLLKKCVLQGSLSLENIHYVIWKKPFMVVSQDTFIADVLSLLGVKVHKSEKKYPEIESDVLKKSFCFFSSEPYPFAKDYKKLIAEGFKGVLVDGEKISWYGIRNLNFLKDLKSFVVF